MASNSVNSTHSKPPPPPPRPAPKPAPAAAHTAPAAAHAAPAAAHAAPAVPRDSVHVSPAEAGGKSANPVANMVHSLGQGDFGQAAKSGMAALRSGLQNAQVAGKLNDLAGQLGDKLGTPEGWDKLNSLLKGTSGVLNHQALQQFRQQYPDQASLKQAFPQLDGLHKLMDPKNLQSWHNWSGNAMRAFSGLSTLRNNLAGNDNVKGRQGKDAVLDGADAHHAIDKLSHDPGFRGEVTSAGNQAANHLRDHRLDGSSRRNGPFAQAVGNVVGNLAQRWVGRHGGQLTEQARNGLHKGLQQAMDGLGIHGARGPQDGGSHNLKYGDVEFANWAGHTLTHPPGSPSDPYQTVHQQISQKLAQQLNQGGVLGLKNGMSSPTPTRAQVQGQIDEAAAHQAAGHVTGEVLSHAFSTMANRWMDQ
ncbi:MAG: hypothetical protein ACYCW6_28340, partial [Candidatus Xenobia bacterium]